MKTVLPEIRIKYAWLLADAASVVMNEKYGDGTSLRTTEEYESIVKKYRTWWNPHSDEILTSLCDILGLEFRQNTIDINVAPWFNPMSDPMVIGPAFANEDELVNTITHELIHRLLTDNTATDYEHDFLSDWTSLFGKEHEWNTLIHIPVHAVMKKLYLDSIDRPDLLQLDIASVASNPSYAAAWTYVHDNNYTDIIKNLSTPR